MSKQGEANRVILNALRLKSEESLSIKSLKGKVSDADVRKELHDTLTVPDDVLDIMHNKLLHWVAEWKGDIITFEDFYEIKSEIAKYDPRKKLIDVTIELLEMRTAAMLSSNPVFVKQMKDIGLPEDMVVDGINNFLRVQGRMATWNSHKLITVENARDFTRDLIDFFNRKEFEIRNEHEGEWDNQRLGRQIYIKCQGNRETKFRGEEPLEKMIEGGYQMLAEQLEVGWPIGWQKKYRRDEEKPHEQH